MRTLFGCALLTLAAITGWAADSDKSTVLSLELRTRVQPFKASPDWRELTIHEKIPARQTAIVLCDVWDDHWCKSAAKRCGVLAKQIDQVLRILRPQGVTIVHAPSDCMDHYKDFPQRRRIKDLARVPTPKPLEIASPPLPIDDADGGCDDATPARSHKAWTREHPAITIADDDFISDNGQEIYSLFKSRDIRMVLVAGVHTNMCVLNRSFAIKQMSRWGMPCVLVRDLTDAMYNPKKAPFVAHEQGTELVIQHIEKHYCPTTLSAELLKK